MIERGQLDELRGAHVCTKDGKNIGSVEGIYIDKETGKPEWVLVNTGWFGHRATFVPLQDATLEAGMLNVPYDEEAIRSVPSVEPDGDISESEENTLYAAYGLPHRPDLTIVSYYDFFPTRKLWRSY